MNTDLSKTDGAVPGPFAALRRFAVRRSVRERCELCAAELAEPHSHLLESERRQVLCACEPCAILFTGAKAGPYRRIPRRVEHLVDFRMDDVQWESLNAPIDLAFFVRGSDRIIAFYPSPGGPTECVQGMDAWTELAADNPVLAELEPDVEALLVYRVAGARDYYRAPIDACFELVGLVRKHWRGLSGGTEVWKQMRVFFDHLQARAGG